MATGLLLSLAACATAPRITLDAPIQPEAAPIDARVVLLLSPALLKDGNAGWLDFDTSERVAIESAIQERLREALVARGFEVDGEASLSEKARQGWESAKAQFREDRVYFHASKLESALSPPMSRWIQAEASVFCALTYNPDILESRTRLAVFVFERGRLVWTRSAFFRSRPFDVLFAGFVGSGVGAEESLDQALLELVEGLPRPAMRTSSSRQADRPKRVSMQSSRPREARGARRFQFRTCSPSAEKKIGLGERSPTAATKPRERGGSQAR